LEKKDCFLEVVVARLEKSKVRMSSERLNTKMELLTEKKRRNRKPPSYSPKTNSDSSSRAGRERVVVDFENAGSQKSGWRMAVVP